VVILTTKGTKEKTKDTKKNFKFFLTEAQGGMIRKWEKQNEK